MAYAKFYKFDIGSTNQEDLIQIGVDIELDNISIPEIAMSKINYFSVEGRQITLSFFPDSTIKSELQDNKASNIHNQYQELMKIYVKIFEGSNQLFAGVIKSDYNYDDYDYYFYDFKVIDGIYAFISYHIENFSVDIPELKYINLYPNDQATTSYNEEIDLDSIDKLSYTNGQRKYYYNLINGLKGGKKIDKITLINAIKMQDFNNSFPMRIEDINYNYDVNIDSGFGSYIDSNTLHSISDIFKERYLLKDQEFDLSVDDYEDKNFILQDNWDVIPSGGGQSEFPLQQQYLDEAKTIINPKFFYFKIEAWTRLSRNIWSDGSINNPLTDSGITIKEVLFVHYVREVLPDDVSVDLLSAPVDSVRKYSKLKQYIEIIKLRFWVEDNKLWFDTSEKITHSAESIRFKSYFDYDTGTGDYWESAYTKLKRIIRNWEVEVNLTRPCLWDAFLPNETFNFRQIYEGVEYNNNNVSLCNIFSQVGVNSLDMTKTIAVVVPFNNIEGNIRIVGDSVLSERAMYLTNVKSIKEFIKTILITFNITMITDNNSDIFFVNRLKDVLNDDINYFTLDDSKTRSITTSNIPRDLSDVNFDMFMFSNAVKLMVDYFYENVFSKFIGERQFTSYKYFFSSEPKINDIIVFRSKQYWISSIKLSDSYESYIIKAYEVRNVLL